MIFAIIAFLGLLVFTVLYLYWKRTQAKPKFTRGSKVKLCVVLGSGGHTMELMRLVKSLPYELISEMFYILADTDKLGAEKIEALESARAEAISGGENEGKSAGSAKKVKPAVPFDVKPAAAFDVKSAVPFEVHRIPRSREVRQSFSSAVVSTLKAILATVPIIVKSRPDVILVNGPGTCVPACLVAFGMSIFSEIFKLSGISGFLGISEKSACRIIFVESICRVSSLSITGKILYHGRFADDVIVQWPDLLAGYPRATYLGRLC